MITIIIKIRVVALIMVVVQVAILTERKKRCIIYTMGFVYPFDVFKL